MRSLPVSPAHLDVVAFAFDRDERLTRMARLEWRLTEGLRNLANQLLHGQLDPSLAPHGWFHTDEATDLEPVLEDAAKRGADVVLWELSYSHEERTGLERALIEYEAIRIAGGWTVVPGGPDAGDGLERGTVARAVVALRERLAVTGDLPVTRPVARPELFDATVEQAVRVFQRRHGLEVDGRVGADTLSALNVPVEARLRQIRVNLERRRWLPRSFGPEYVWVNVPEYRLYAFRDGRQVLDMNVIVGKPTSETPLFADRLEYIVFNPYWNVPESISLHDLLPRHEADAGYLRNRHYQVVDADSEPVPFDRLNSAGLERGTLRIRRLPGPFNDLGRIKFMMLNPYQVYLHDTPSRHLFSRPRRAFSHGCVRLERPLDLASYALPKQASTGRIEDELRAPPGARLALERPIPVFIVYFTAFMENGLVQFRDDVYQRDRAVWRELQAAQARTGPAVVASVESGRKGSIDP